MSALFCFCIVKKLSLRVFQIVSIKSLSVPLFQRGKQGDLRVCNVILSILFHIDCGRIWCFCHQSLVISYQSIVTCHWSMVIRLRRKLASLCICHALFVVNNHGLSGLFSFFSFLPLLVLSLSVSPIHRFIVSLITHPSSSFHGLRSYVSCLKP